MELLLFDITYDELSQNEISIALNQTENMFQTVHLKIMVLMMMYHTQWKNRQN